MNDTDPRLANYRKAACEMDQGLSAPEGARERYRQSLLPYVEYEAERTPSHVRKHMMCALFGVGLPLGVIAAGYRATKEELDYVSEHPPIRPESVDETSRLRKMSYGLYLKSAHWQAVRKAALDRAGNRCALCNSDQHLQVHHRTYYRRGSERPADVIVLCDSCHSRHHDHLHAA